MSTAVLTPGFIVSLVCGVLCHVVFNRIEPRDLSLIATLLFIPPFAITLILGYNVFISTVLYLGGLLGSLVVYRLSPFHPLAEYPGPVICKITRLWAAYIVQSGKQHLYYKDLHAKYGTHVRTGPNHLMICDAEALPVVMANSPFHRGERYEASKLSGAKGLLTTIDPIEHAHRRRIWDRGLNVSAVQGYSDLLDTRVLQLIGLLEKTPTVDLATSFSCFSFDFMGDLAFGGSFQLLKQGSDTEGYMNLTRLSLMFSETVGTIPWLKPVYSHLPSSSGMLRLREFSKKSVLSRISMSSTLARKDIFYYLLDEENFGNDPPNLPTLMTESKLVIIAGSDTTATALSNAFFFLLSAPDTYSKLRAEVDSAFPPGADISSGAAMTMSKMKYLNAVINETLRLQPAVPNGIQRHLPRRKGKGGGGVMVAGRWIPEGTTVQIPPYSVHRNPCYFGSDAESFRPERWLSDSTDATSKLDQGAYFPFSFGPTNCAGKNLALLELRLVITSLLQRFDITLAPEFELNDWEKNLKDYFVLMKGELTVDVKVRTIDSNS